MSFNTNQRRNRVRYTPQRNRSSNTKRNHKKYIDPAKFVKAASSSVAEQYVPQHSFSDFELDAQLLTNLQSKGYEHPSPIQDQAIPQALQGNDIIGIASTGTGKTASFALPVLHKLLKNSSKAIIIAPTRELAEQIEAECRALAQGTGIRSVLLIGGTNMGGQFRGLRQQPNLIIGTPGRIKDHLKRGSLQLKQFDTVVLDEVDRMLDMGFVQDVTEILTATQPSRQVLFFSATMDAKIERLITTFTQSPCTIRLQASSSSDAVNQDIIAYAGELEKIEKLHDLLLDEQVTKAIIFDETKRNVEKLEDELASRGFASTSIHGGKTQGQRKRALASFKSSTHTILVATDVAARGIDVSDITHVINYSTPNDYQDYVHRIGRAGRAGRVGYAFTFVPQHTVRTPSFR